MLTAESAPLPASVVRLLDSYRESNGGRTPRLWSAGADAWLCLYPADAPGPAAQPAGARVELGWLDDMRLELELPGGSSDELEFLAAALEQVLGFEREARSAAHELSERYEEINLLYSISEILASMLSLESASSRILEEVADVLGARRAALWVYDAAAERLELRAAVGEEGLSGPIDVNDGGSITARVFRDRQPINLERGDRLPTGATEPRPHGDEPYLSVPINYTPPDGANRTIGVITLVGRRSDVRFSAGDMRLLTAIASQVGAALETQRLVRESLHRERIERELELAHDLQLKLLPDASHFAGMADVAARCMPADSVGGDFYNLFHLANGRLGVVIGDVSSHGFSAALIMALTMSAIAIYAQEAGPPGEVLKRVHQALIEELESTEMYLTLFYGVIDQQARRIVYANAGHPHAFAILADGGVHRLGATSPPLGTVPLPEYGEGDFSFGDPKDLLCLFTDGLSDAFAGTAGMGGEKQLLAEVVRRRLEPPARILAELFDAVGNHRLSVPPDDRTAVLLRS